MINNKEAALIAEQWHSVMTWNDPGVSMYSVTSTGKVHSERHRQNLLAYVDTCMDVARTADAQGEPPVLESHATNVEELEEFKQWVIAFKVTGAPSGSSTGSKIPT